MHTTLLATFHRLQTPLFYARSQRGGADISKVTPTQFTSQEIGTDGHSHRPAREGLPLTNPRAEVRGNEHHA